MFLERREINLAFLLCGIAHDRVDVCEWIMDKQNVHPGYLGYLDDASFLRRFLIQVCVSRRATHCYIWFRKRFAQETPNMTRYMTVVAPQLWSFEQCQRDVWLKWASQRTLKDLLVMMREWTIQAGECASLLSSISLLARLLFQSYYRDPDEDIENVLELCVNHCNMDRFAWLLGTRLDQLVCHPSLWLWLTKHSDSDYAISQLLQALAGEPDPRKKTIALVTAAQEDNKKEQLSRIASCAIKSFFYRRPCIAKVYAVLLPYVDCCLLQDCIDRFELLRPPTSDAKKIAFLPRTVWTDPILVLFLKRKTTIKAAQFEHNCRGEYARRLRDDAHLEALVGELFQLPSLESSVIAMGHRLLCLTGARIQKKGQSKKPRTKNTKSFLFLLLHRHAPTNTTT